MKAEISDNKKEPTPLLSEVSKKAINEDKELSIDTSPLSSISTLSPLSSSLSSLSSFSSEFPESKNRLNFFPNNFKDSFMKPEMFFQDGIAESMLARRLKEVLEVIRPLLMASNKLKFRDYPYYYESESVDFNVQRDNENLAPSRLMNVAQASKPFRRPWILLPPLPPLNTPPPSLQSTLSSSSASILS